MNAQLRWRAVTTLARLPTISAWLQGAVSFLFFYFFGLTLWGSGTHDRSQSRAPPILVRNYMELDEIGSAAMLATKRSAGVTPEVNLRIPFSVGNEVCKQRDPPWLWKLGQMSPEVQNGGISGPTKRTDVLQKNFFYFFFLLIASGVQCNVIFFSFYRWKVHYDLLRCSDLCWSGCLWCYQQSRVSCCTVYLSSYRRECILAVFTDPWKGKIG